MNTLSQTKILLIHLDWNIKHLQEILKNPKNNYYRDASIQRFGYTMELVLKCLSAFLQTNKIPHSDSQTLFQAASGMYWFKGTGSWEPVVQDYEQIKEGFKDNIGETVYLHLPNHLVFFQKLYLGLSTISTQKDSI